MIRQTAAKRYAEATFDLALESSTVEAWSAALGLIAEVFSHPQVAAVMASARVPTTDKVKFGERTLEGIEPVALNLARLLITKGRTGLAPQIAQAFQELVDDAQGIAHALVKTAVPLSDDEKKAVAQKLQEVTGKQVVLESEVDDRLIGGLVVRIGDRLLDGSTKSRLLALKRQLQEART